MTNQTPHLSQTTASMAHRRSTSDSSAPIFVAHSLQFAGQGEEEDTYHAAQRYDWDDVPAKLTEPRTPYEPTRAFDYIVPKKIKVLGSTENLVGARRSTRSRKDENTPVGSESEVARQLNKKRGRPRRSEASRKTDDGDHTEDESYMEPTSGTKRRSQHPSKRPRVSRNEEPSRREETDEEHERDTAPLRSGGARSRVTPIKPQQANRWSNTEDRQLIDSLFEVIGSIPWRRVTAYMAEKGFTCADRGEGAIRGRWKVLRPRLYIVPPPVVRGAAAKSQSKAKEKEPEAEAEHDEKEVEVEHEDKEGDQEELEEQEAERAAREAAEQAAQDIEDELDAVEARGREVEGDTTVEEDDPPAPRRERARGTGPPKRPREHREQPPPTPPRIPTPPTLTVLSPIPNRRTLPSLQSPERTSERSLPLPIVNIADKHSPRLGRPLTPPQTGTLLAPMLAGGGWDERWMDERGRANSDAHTSPGRAHPILPEPHREYPPNPHPVDPHPPRKSRKPEMHPFRTSAPGPWSQNPVQVGPGGYQGPATSGYQAQGAYQAPTAGQAPPVGQGAFQTYQSQAYNPSSIPGQTYSSPPQTFQPTVSPRVYQTQTSPRPTYAPTLPQVYHSPSRPLPGQTYHNSPPSQAYPSRPPYHPHPPSYQGPASQVFPPPPLYVPPPTTFPIESQSPGRATFQDSPTFSGSRLPMLGERGEGVREWDRIE